MAHNQDNLNGQREYILQLLQQLTAQYPPLKSELNQIQQQYPGTNEEFSFLEKFELLIVTISGYAKQIQTTGTVKQGELAIAHLHQLQIFANTSIAPFYIESQSPYPKVQAYLQLLDYLRLVILEYLQFEHTIHPISA